MERNTDPIGKGLSPFQKLTQAEMFPNSPASYKSETYTSALYPVLHKVGDTEKNVDFVKKSILVLDTQQKGCRFVGQ